MLTWFSEISFITWIYFSTYRFGDSCSVIAFSDNRSKWNVFVLVPESILVCRVSPSKHGDATSAGMDVGTTSCWSRLLIDPAAGRRRADAARRRADIGSWYRAYVGLPPGRWANDFNTTSCRRPYLLTWRRRVYWGVSVFSEVISCLPVSSVTAAATLEVISDMDSVRVTMSTGDSCALSSGFRNAEIFGIWRHSLHVLAVLSA